LLTCYTNSFLAVLISTSGAVLLLLADIAGDTSRIASLTFLWRCVRLVAILSPPPASMIISGTILATVVNFAIGFPRLHQVHHDDEEISMIGYSSCLLIVCL